MKKQIPWSTIIDTAVPVLVVTAIIALLLILSSGSDLTYADPEVITPIDFTPSVNLADEDVLVAENDGFALWANLATTKITLYQKDNDTYFTSVPETLEEEDIKNSAKFQLSALLSFRYSDRDSNAFNSQNSFAGSVRKGDYRVQQIEDGIRFEFYFDNEGFLIPLEIKLTQTGIHASVPLKDVRERSNRTLLTSVTVLPNFGAAQPSDEGYMLLPDGSGILADFSTRSFTYSQRIYGKDYAVINSTSSGSSQTARMPIYGIKRGDSAFLSVISSGAARAYVEASAPTAKSPYATVAARFVYREVMTVEVSQKTFESTQVNVFESSPCSLDAFSVEYLLCEEASYISMADSYRQYLQEQGMEILSESRDALYVDLIGGVECQQSVMGIPVDKVLPVTDYEAAAKILQQLQQSGVNRFQVSYRYWNQGGAEGLLTTSLDAEAALGGKRGLIQFLQYCQQEEIPLYLELNLTDMRKSQPGFLKTYAAAQSVRSEPVIAYDYYLSTFQQKTDGSPLYLLSPGKVFDAVDEVIPNLGNWSVAGYNAGTLANKIYSDMGARSIDRGAAEAIMKAALASLAAESKLQLSAANAYAFSYADTITDVPLYSSGYLIETCSVPFYSMVMHGMAYMSSEDINGYLDPAQALLRALEAGVGLKYAFGWENVAELSDTAISEYGYIEAHRWLTHAAEQYQQLHQFLSAVSNRIMTEHILISKDVRYSEFDNGMGVYVNYSNQDVSYGDLIIPANGYVLQLSEEGA